MYDLWKRMKQILSKGRRSLQISVNNLTRNPSIFTLFNLSKTLGNMSPHTFASFTFVSFCGTACSESSWFPMTFSDSIRTSVSQFCWGISVSSSLSFFLYFLSVYFRPRLRELFLFFRHFLYIWKIIASNKIDLAVYSSDVLLLSSKYFGENLSFDWKYCVSKALLLYSVNIIQVLSL